MKKHLCLLLVGIVALIVAAAPGPAAVPAVAQTIITVTPSPAIPPPLTVATVQPTVTPLSALARQTESMLQTAFNRTALVAAYRMKLVARGAGTVAGASSAREEILLHYEGSYNGADVSYTFRAPDLRSQGLDPGVGLAAVSLDGISYGRGPLPFHGASEPVWYNLGSQSIYFLQPRYQLAELLRRVSETLPLSTLTRGRSETIDSRRCTAYQSDKDAVQNVLTVLGRPLVAPRGVTQGSQYDLRIDRGAVIVWHCADGLLRRIQIVAAGRVVQRPATVFSSNLLIELSDLNGKVEITAPEDAQTLERAPEFDAVSVRGGPIRSLRGSGMILGQLNPQESVVVIERSIDYRWYRVRAPGATGWVGATLLSISPTIARRVPVVSS